MEKVREDVLDALEIRFTAVPSSIVGAIDGIENLSILKQLLKRAITVDSLSEFENT